MRHRDEQNDILVGLSQLVAYHSFFILVRHLGTKHFVRVYMGTEGLGVLVKEVGNDVARRRAREDNRLIFNGDHEQRSEVADQIGR